MLHQRNHALQKVQFFLFRQSSRLHALGAQQHVHPLLGGEVCALRDHLVQVQIRQLDGLQAGDTEGGILRTALLLFALFIVKGIILIGIGDAGDAPDAAHEDFGVLNRIFALNNKRLNFQVGKFCNVIILILV